MDQNDVANVMGSLAVLDSVQTRINHCPMVVVRKDGKDEQEFVLNLNADMLHEIQWAVSAARTSLSIMLEPHLLKMPHGTA